MIINYKFGLRLVIICKNFSISAYYLAVGKRKDFMFNLMNKRVVKPLVTGAAILSALVSVQSSERAIAAEITTSPGYSVSIFALNPPNTSSPDSVAIDGNKVYIGYGDGTKSDGSDNLPSTVAEFTMNGKLVRTFSVPGHNDGLRVDPTTHQVYALLNQDGNPKLTIINPRTGAEQTYTLPSINGGGGYDDLVFLKGQIFIDASEPELDSNGVNNNPVLGTLTLSGGQATVTPVLSGNTTAVDSATGQTITLNLTDPDSLGITPDGGLVIDGEADRNLVTVTNPGTPQQRVSVVSHPDFVADDTIFAPAAKSSLLVADTSGGAVYLIKGYFDPGTAYISAASTGSVGTFDTTSGAFSPVITGLGSPHGLGFLPRKLYK